MEWFFPNGLKVENDTVVYSYDTVGMVYPILLLTVDDAQTCDKYFQDSIYVRELIARINENVDDFIGCRPFQVAFQSESIGADSWSWDFGTGENATTENTLYIFDIPGEFDVELIVSDEAGCQDSASVTTIVHPTPVLTTSPDTLICLGDSANIWVEGANLYNWYPNYNLSDNLSSRAQAFPFLTTTYLVEAIDTNNCINYADVIVKVQQEPQLNINDTSIIIGETVVLDASSNEIANHNWSSLYDIACPNCSLIEVKPLEKTTFNLSYSDTIGCFLKNHQVIIDVIEGYTVDVPTAFTPNGDGVNDYIFVRGWGIKELLGFKIFNRFGQLVFETNDISEGWDGTNSGGSQNVETFTYQVKVKTYDDNILTKIGTIKLLR